MSVNTHGNFNEHELIEALNSRYIEDLSDNLKSFVKTLYPDISNDDIIIAEKTKKPESNKSIHGNIKPDVTLKVKGKEFHISVKIGSGNSVHQENTEAFLKYLKETFCISESLVNDFRLYVWGDGTLDGSAPVKDRLKGDKVITKYPSSVKNIREFFEKNKSKLIDRFLFTGRFDISVDYVYYGNEEKGVWASKEELMPHIIKTGTGKNSIYIGILTFQTYGRSLQGKDDKRREQIQIKCGALEKVLKEISIGRGDYKVNHAIEGFENEKEFIKFNNKNKSLDNKVWKFLIEDLDLSEDLSDKFLVKASKQVVSKIHKRKVYPKSDAYLMYGNISKEYLEKVDYLLDEKNIDGLGLSIVKFSGISLKKDTSKSFQIMKISPDPFYKLFRSYELGAGASVYCDKIEEIYKNNEVISGWKSNIYKIKEYFKDIEGIDSIDDINVSVEEKMKIYKAIKNYSTKQIHYMVINNKNISDAIFKGEGIFEEPYVAHYLLSHGEFGKNKPYSFSITTGSGRSNGKYQLEFKPRKIKKA